MMSLYAFFGDPQVNREYVLVSMSKGLGSSFKGTQVTTSLLHVSCYHCKQFAELLTLHLNLYII